MRFEEHYYLQEMIVSGKPEEGSYIVAFNKWIWVLDEETPDKNIIKDIISKIPEDIDTEYVEDETEDTYDFITSLSESVEDILIGRLTDNELYIEARGSFTLDPKSSILVKKVVKQLGIDSVSYMEDLESTETSVHKTDIKGKIPSTVYHGTSSNYLISISKIGLHPSKSESNYLDQGIAHHDKIFFSTRIGEAMHHATHTAHKQGGVPIILEMKIPDKAKIVADYDVEDMTGKNEFYNYHYRGERKVSQDKPMSLSKEFGVYGYKGNIKPRFIDSVYVSTKGEDAEVYSIDEFVELDMKEALEELFPEEYGDWGDGEE